MAEERIYIGRVEYVRPIAGGYRFAKVAPLLRSSQDRKRWEGAVTNPVEEFPARGQVFWHDAPLGLDAGSYWSFEPAEQPNFDGDERSEQYRVENVEPTIEIIDLRNLGSESDLRRLTTQEGIRTDPLPLTSKVLIRISEEVWVGPVEIRPSTANGTWRIAPDENLVSLDCRRLPDSSVQPVSLHGPRLILTPSHDLGRHSGYLNWTSDVDLAKGVLRRLRKLDRAAVEASGATDAIFQKYIAALQRAELLGKDLRQELGRAERVRELRDIVAGNTELLQEAVASLMKSDEVREELKFRKERVYRRIRARQQRRVQAELESNAAELHVVRSRVEEGIRELHDLEAKLEGKRTELDQTISRFEGELTRRLHELTAIPERAFAELAITRAFVNPGVHTSTEGADRSDRSRIRAVSVEASTASLSDRSETMSAVAQSFQATEFSPFLGLYLHAAFLAGAVPVLTGPKAYGALMAYASAVAGGRLLWIPVPSSAFEPQDLLGRPDPTFRRIVPHPGGLLETLTLRAGEALSVIVLEGFNRAPVESYLMPLLEVHHDAGTARGGRTIPVFSGEVDPGDPFQAYSRVQWRPEALLAMLPVAGTAVLPVPASFWRHAILIDTERFVSDEEPPTADGQKTSQVDPDRWVAWRAERHDSTGIREVLSELAGRFGSVVREVGDVTTRLYTAGRSCGMSHTAGLRFVFETALIPAFWEQAEEIESFVREAKIEIEDPSGVLAVAARISA